MDSNTAESEYSVTSSWDTKEQLVCFQVKLFENTSVFLNNDYMDMFYYI
jgi:hypothetical protein